MIQILISLGILLLWALTSLLSRETQPLPPRPLRPRPGEGPRPAGEPPAESDIRASAIGCPAMERTLAPAADSLRVARAVSIEARRPRPLDFRPDRRPRPAEAGQGPATEQPDQPQHGAGRQPPARNHSPRNPTVLAQLHAHSAGHSSAPLEPRTFRNVAAALDAQSARAMLGSPEKLREIAILTEILKPPLALRHPRRSH